MIGKGAGHSLTIGATIVIERAIIPHDPTEVFLLFEGKILSSVKETWVVMMKLMMIPIFKMRMRIGMNFSSKVSLCS